ncbi:hypothetical protein L0F63_004487, partial [Massospora cicadina]
LEASDMEDIPKTWHYATFRDEPTDICSDQEIPNSPAAAKHLLDHKKEELLQLVQKYKDCIKRDDYSWAAMALLRFTTLKADGQQHNIVGGQLARFPLVPCRAEVWELAALATPGTSSRAYFRDLQSH